MHKPSMSRQERLQAFENPKRVLQVGALLPWLEEKLSTRYNVERLPEAPLSEAFLAENGHAFRAVITSARFGVDADLMSALPNLGAVINFGVGYETTDLQTARERGIVVSNTPDVLTGCVADLAVGALIAVMRRIPAADQFVRRGDWMHESFPLTTRVNGKRIGILGLGRIGSTIARRLEGFDVEIRYHNRSEIDGADYRYARSPEELARDSDILVVATAGGEGTRGLVSASVLDALGPEGYVVNISRGSVIDESSLIEAVRRRNIAGAALDVFVHEPNVPSELLDLDNVLLLPHISSATRETRQAMAQLALDNLASFMADGTLVTPVLDAQ